MLLSRWDNLAKFLEFKKIIPIQFLKQIARIEFSYSPYDSSILFLRVMDITKFHSPLITRNVEHEDKEFKNADNI